jgi:ABC-type multidrug transport system permease subunit
MNRTLKWVIIIVIGLPVVAVLGFFIYLVAINTTVKVSGNITVPGSTPADTAK